MCKKTQWSTINIRFITDLEKKCIQTQNPFTFEYIYQRIQRCHNKSFIATRLLSPRESFTVNPLAKMKQGWKRKETVCYKPRSLKHRGITRKLEYHWNCTVGSLALPSIDTKMAKMPTYTQNYNISGTKNMH